MKFLVIATTVLHLAWAASIVDVTCPDFCTCQPNDEHLETSCSSYEFIKKLLPKQETTITRLSINDASLLSVDLKLKYLKNLQSLDLSRNAISSLPSQFPYLPKLESLNLSKNHLSEIGLSQLPKNLRVIDVSHNLITSFPKDISSLKQLKVLHLHDNPIDCDCDNLEIYEELVKEDIAISDDLICYSPKEFHGRSLKSINCSLIKENLLNSMLGDEPGSGLEELEETREFGSTSPIIADEDEQFIRADGVTTEHTAEEEEGSGVEGSGFIPILPFSETPKACHFNCSTPKPIGLSDEKNASPLPSVQEQAKMILEDLLLPESVTTSTPAASTPPQIKETKEEATSLNEKSDKELVHSDVELVPTNDTVVGEMERASIDGSNTQSVYIIVGLLVAFVAFLIIYYVNKKKNQKKRNNRKRNKSNENGFGEEMKPLGKSADVKPLEPINSKVPETAPLLNGKNGTISDDGLKIPPIDANDDEVEIRKPNNLDSLTPQPERVTIKAGELPDSVPKTPLLVHRQLNSDGEIVTTAVNSD